jgi:hypothetical protein
MLMREGGRLAANEGQHMADGRYILQRPPIPGAMWLIRRAAPKARLADHRAPCGV